MFYDYQEIMALSAQREESVDIFALNSSAIAALIDCHQSMAQFEEQPLDEVFKEILRVANEFVPSRAGSILLRGSGTEEHLIFVASFGERASTLLGKVVPPGRGISGTVYETGKPALVNDPRTHKNFYSAIDSEMKHTTESILCVPVKIRGLTVGVLSLLNRTEGDFHTRDLDLMKVFSDYVSSSLQGHLQARRQAEIAKIDHLTGLYNDRYFFERVSQELARVENSGENLGLIFFDLDRFKSVVDSYGHLMGSQALREVGLLLARTVDHPGAVLARYGGDEYVVLLPGAELAEIAEQAEKIRSTIESAVLFCTPDAEGKPPLKLEGAVTASIGTASLHHCSLVGQDLRARRHQFIRMADEAMYRAKAEGKNRVCSAHQYMDVLEGR